MELQYIIIGILFLLALFFLFKKLLGPVFKKKDKGCGKGNNCGCG